MFALRVSGELGVVAGIARNSNVWNASLGGEFAAIV